jgi:hypothetical protein
MAKRQGRRSLLDARPEVTGEANRGRRSSLPDRIRTVSGKSAGGIIVCLIAGTVGVFRGAATGDFGTLAGCFAVLVLGLVGLVLPMYADRILQRLPSRRKPHGKRKL